MVVEKKVVHDELDWGSEKGVHYESDLSCEEKQEDEWDEGKGAEEGGKRKGEGE